MVLGIAYNWVSSIVYEDRNQVSKSSPLLIKINQIQKLTSWVLLDNSLRIRLALLLSVPSAPPTGRTMLQFRTDWEEGWIEGRCKPFWVYRIFRSHVAEWSSWKEAKQQLSKDRVVAVAEDSPAAKMDQTPPKLSACLHFPLFWFATAF